MASKKVFVTGHRGFVGRNIVKELKNTYDIEVVTYSGNLKNFDDLSDFFITRQPDMVIHAAAKCGGIFDNMQYPFEYIMHNLEIQNNVIRATIVSDIKDLIFLGSSCTYPKYAEQPYKEESILTGSFEPTNEYYALAKVTGQKLCQAHNKQYGTNFITIHPCNVYGPGDRFDITGHVIGGLIYRFDLYKVLGTPKGTLTIPGKSTTRREFIYVSDLAHIISSMAYRTLNDDYSFPEVMNIGPGVDHSIGELAYKIRDIMNLNDVAIEWDETQPQGMHTKLLDVSLMKQVNLDKHIVTDIDEGLKKAIESYEKSLY